MHFPFRILGVHPHLIFETLAYAIGFRTYLALRRRAQDPVADRTRFLAVAGAALGAAIGSKLLHWLYEPAVTLAHLGDWRFMLGGKTLVGGLLGGVVGVECTKRWIGETRSTGDLYVLPLCVGIAIGRIGCFLTGLEDLTYGNATALPWGVDLGDGVLRHPTALYELGALALIAVWAWRHLPARSGDTFRGFMFLYLSFRLLVDPLKPEPRVLLGLSSIQIACVVGIAYYLRHLARVFSRSRTRELHE